jgi:hypothetical protein
MGAKNFNELITAAIVDDRAAKSEALAMGLLATRPLSAARLQQLCALGERMMHASLRRKDAERDVADATSSGFKTVDMLLPQ